MPEEIIIPAAGEGSKDGAGAGEGQKEGADQKDITNKTDAGEGGSGEGENGGVAPKEGDKAKAPKEGEEEVDDLVEPVVRQRLSKQDFIIGRQHKKLAKAAKAGGKGEGEGEGGESGEGDDDVDEADEALINKVVAKNFAPIIDKSLAADDNEEVLGFLTENPDFKPFEAKARRYMAHPSRRNLPIKSIFYEVAGDKLIKIGAERERAAIEKAKGSQTGGGSNRGGEGVKDDWQLPADDFKAKQERIRRGQ